MILVREQNGETWVYIFRDDGRVSDKEWSLDEIEGYRHKDTPLSILAFDGVADLPIEAKRIYDAMVADNVMEDIVKAIVEHKDSKGILSDIG